MGIGPELGIALGQYLWKSSHPRIQWLIQINVHCRDVQRSRNRRVLHIVHRAIQAKYASI